MGNSLEDLYSWYCDTFTYCGVFLLELTDEEIEYRLFEEFIIGVGTFLYSDNLAALEKAGYINEMQFSKSKDLREMVLKMEISPEWNAVSVRNSEGWMKIMLLSDEIHNSLCIK